MAGAGSSRTCTSKRSTAVGTRTTNAKPPRNMKHLTSTSRRTNTTDSIITRRRTVTGSSYGPKRLTVRDRDIAAALETATSQEVFDLAQAAGNRRDGKARPAIGR